MGLDYRPDWPSSEINFCRKFHDEKSHSTGNGENIRPSWFPLPITIRAKILLQEIWRQEFDWDTPLPDEIQTQWLRFAEDLNSIIPKRYSRCYFQESKTHPTTQSPDERNSHETDDVCLHVFCDASPKAYGSVIYITSGNQSARVIARTRVAPLKQLTLPRLELMAAVIGSRLLHHVLQTIPTKSIHMWSDSQIVLHWLSSNRKLKTFEQNRVAEIHRLTDNKQWMYCPTDQNPADLLTRGVKAEELQKSKLWESGPDWLTNVSNYPKQPLMTSTVLLTDVTDQTTNIADPPSSQTIQGVHNIIDVNRYSRFRKLLRVTAYVKRFIHNCRFTKYSTDILTVQELSDAERLWINSCQATTYSAEVTCMKSGKRNLPLVRQLQLYLDEDGLIRCAGRIHNAPLDELARFPYLLPANHQLTRLIVLDAHERHLHAGTSALIAFMRQKYWIPTIRQCIQKILRTCNQCCRVTGRPYSAPDPPPLPKIRVQDTKPFTVAGVDFTGALNIRSKMGNEKAYICLFTCASTRAVHLEVVRDLSESSFVRAFRRFTSRKSLPKIMVSDNGTTFRAAANTIERLVNSESIQETLRDRGTEWKFIPKRAPWFGGWWERLIGLTKTAIKKVLGKAYVTYDTLQTVVTEIECIMNDRPLTYVTSEEADPEPLTPAHLLYGRRISSLPYNDKVPDSSSLTHDGLTKQARVQTQLINHFRDRWVHEYLTSLRQFHKITGNNNQKIRVGDVVLIHNETKRSQWKMGKVVSLVTGRDGQSRAAMVRTSNGQTTSRPIVKLYPLETTINSRPGGCREDVCS